MRVAPPYARVVSRKLNDGKYLSDLLDFDTPGWKTNFITVNNGSTDIFTSTPSTWWSNPVVEDNDGMLAGDAQPGTIYIVTADPGVDYTFSASRAALVVKPTVTLTGDASGFGALFVDNYPFPQDYVWVEGTLQAANQYISALNISDVRFSSMRNVKVTGVNTYGVDLTCQNCMVADITASGAKYTAVDLGGDFLTVSNITVTGSDSGLALAANQSTVDTVSVSDAVSGASTTAIGVNVLGDYNTLSNVSISEVNSYAVRIQGDNNTVSDVNIADSDISVSYGLVIDGNATGNTVSDVVASGAYWYNFNIAGTYNRVMRGRSTWAATVGVVVGGYGNRVSDITIGNLGHGLQVYGKGNIIWNVVSAQNGDQLNTSGGKGVYLKGLNNNFELDNNILANLTVTNNQLQGIALDNHQSVVLMNVTVANTGSIYHLTTTPAEISYGGVGLQLQFLSAQANFSGHNIALLRNAGDGINTTNSTINGVPIMVTESVFNNLAAIGNATRGYSPQPVGIRLAKGIMDLVFTGALLVGGNGIDPSTDNCKVTPEDPSYPKTNAGLLDGTCANAVGSDATLDFGAATPAVVGLIGADDPVNGSDDASGTANFGTFFSSGIATEDWTAFDSSLRAWGIGEGAGTALDGSHQGQCWDGLLCAIYDWSLSSADTVLRDAVALNLSGDNFLIQKFVAPQQVDCDYVGGVWDGANCTSTYLNHAMEVMDDGIGNENLLCESGETCIFTPNIGSYQGHGTLVSAGTFSDGTISNVTLMKYNINGR